MLKKLLYGFKISLKGKEKLFELYKLSVTIANKLTFSSVICTNKLLASVTLLFQRHQKIFKLVRHF